MSVSRNTSANYGQKIPERISPLEDQDDDLWNWPINLVINFSILILMMSDVECSWLLTENYIKA